MNQRLVAIAVGSLVLLFALACAAFAWRASTVPAAPAVGSDAATAPGGALWASRCARCHEAAEFTGGLAGPGRIAAASTMLRQLESHGGTGFAEDLLLIQWLASQAEAGRGASERPAEPPADEPQEEDDFTL
jgi:hypothetical protein